MAINLGVKALLGWVNKMKLSEDEITIEGLRDGTVFLKIVCMLKKMPTPCFSNSFHDPLQLVADFIERDCRFNASKGTSLCWDDLRAGINLTVEVAKVLLLLAYNDVMNDRSTLKMLDCDTERQIAYLTDRFVMESEGCVYLSDGLDAHLAKKCLTANSAILEQSIATSSSSVSTLSTLSDEDSPIFYRKQRIQFLDVQTVASSSVSKSPLQDIMNTPKFQMRKMQRQMIKERDYRDGLERELSSKVALIAQKEIHINQLQYRLDKLKEEKDNREQVIRDEINELETRNDSLQMRYNEILKQNKDLKCTSSLMERKVDELSDENGALSSQMRGMCSQLDIYKEEVGRLTQSQNVSQEEWIRQKRHLESELTQATAQKELLTEQIQILQGKISCLEDEKSRASEEVVGENMGPIIEKEMFEREINHLKNELESASCSLKGAEVEILAKTQQLAVYEEEITQQKELLSQQELRTTELIQAKEETLDKLQIEINKERAVFQQEIRELKLQLKQIEQEKIEEMCLLQQKIATCEQEVEKLKHIRKEKEKHLHLAEEKLKDFEKKLSAVQSLLADKDQQITSLRGDVESLSDENKGHKNEILLKEEHLAKLILEQSNEKQLFNINMQGLSVQVEGLSASLKQAEQEVQLRQNLLATAQQENVQQKAEFQHQLVACEKTVEMLNKEIQEKSQKLDDLRNDASKRSESLEQNIKNLNSQIKHLNDCLQNAEEQVHAQEFMLAKHEAESARQMDILQQQLSASEERIRSMKEEIQTKEDQLNELKWQSSEQSEKLQQEIHDLKEEVVCLMASLMDAEENLVVKENLLGEQHLQSTRDMEALRVEMGTFQDEVKRLNVEIQKKEERFILLRTETSSHSDILQQEIESLNEKLKRTSDTLEITKDEIQAKNNLMVKHEQEGSRQKELLQQQLSASQEAVRKMKEELHAKEEQMMRLQADNSAQSDVLRQEIQVLQKKVESLTSSLTFAEENLQSKEKLFAEQQLQTTQDKEALQTQMAASQNEVKRLNEEVHVKEEELALLKTETSTRAELLQQEIEALNQQIKTMSDSLDVANDQVQATNNLMAQQEQERMLLIEDLRKHKSVLEEDANRLREELKIKEDQINTLKCESCKESEVLHNEIKTRRERVESLEELLKTSTEQVQYKDNLLRQKEIEISEEKAQFKSLMANSEIELRELSEQIRTKDEQLVTLQQESSINSGILQQEIKCLKDKLAQVTDLLSKSEEKVQTQLVMLKEQEQENAHQKELLQQQLSTSEGQVTKMNDEVQLKEAEMLLLKTESSAQLDMLRKEIVALGCSLKKAEEDMQSKENAFAQQQLEHTRQRETLKSQHDTQLEILQKQIHLLESEIQKLKASQSEKDCLLLKAEEKLHFLQTEVSAVSTLMADKDDSLNTLREEVAAQANLIQEANKAAAANEKILAETKEEKSKSIESLHKDIQVQKLERKSLEKQLEAIVVEKDRLEEAKEAIERENKASHKLKSLLQREMEVMKSENDKLLKEREKAEETEADLQKQLVAKSEAVEHYKAQMDKAVKHYNSKKQLLQESEEEVAGLKHSLEVKESEAKAVTMENKMLQLDLDKTRNNEKNLVKMVASLEAQLAFADCNLRAQNKTYCKPESCYNAQVKRTISSDSLDESPLEDSLNTTRKLSAPDESSTPLVRSSERLAAKRRDLQDVSLETLYYTPINNRASKERKLEFSSTKKNPASSIKRRRTTQVINITMTKKTPCGGEDETFYSLAPARSQPNLSTADSKHPVCVELCDTPARRPGAASDQLIGLPGYRRSAVHSQPTSTFCTGAENEPENAPEDWMRIAELQARNKACLPHLKSSYPVEFDQCRGSGFFFTDEELRTGDPSDTIRRASMMPGQLQDTLTSHRHALMMGHAGTRSHRLSLMPGQLPSITVDAAQLRSQKGTKRASSTVSVNQMSPEKKVKASCFPRPLSPMNKNMISSSSTYQLHPTLSPADRRESMMFTIDNTPKKNNYLKKGLNKLRSSTRKSPGKNTKLTPQDSRENIQFKNPRAEKACRIGSTKSPLATKGQKSSPRVTGRAAKSPGLTAGARKMMSKGKK